MNEPTSAIRHYGTSDLTLRVKEALREAGFGDGPVPMESLAPLDQFHTGGIAATRAVATRLGVERGTRVLDVGCGVGGSSRYLAGAYGCNVTGVDLNAPFIELASMLTERTGQSESVHHLVADATALPFDAKSFDLAWTQHVAMNVANRHALYAEIFRILKPGGRFALYDVTASDTAPFEYPAPWARLASDSFLLTIARTQAALEEVGFVVAECSDVTADAMTWAAAQPGLGANAPQSFPKLGIPLLMDADFPSYVANLGRNLREGRAKICLAIAKRPQT